MNIRNQTKAKKFTSLAAPLLILAFAAMPQKAFAACTVPTGAAGDIIYNGTYNVLQYCNGTNWVNAGSLGSAGGTLTSGDFCTSNGTLINCTTPYTGTGNVVLSASPTFTGSVNGASSVWSGTVSGVNSTWTGQVAIGTTSTSGALNVAGTITSTGETINGTATATTFSGAHTGSGSGLTGIGTASLGGITGTASSSTFLAGNGTWTSIASAGGATGIGTANYLPLWTGTSTLSNSAVYQNGSNVGIGTTAPATALQVSGTATATTFSGSGASLTSIGTSNLSAITGTPSSTTYLRGDGTWAVAGSGTVSVGTQYQMAYYAANGSVLSGDSAITTNASNDLNVNSGSINLGSGYLKIGSGYGIFATLGVNELFWSDHISFTYSGTDRMTILNGGNVGIGSTNPRSLLDVAGTVYATTFSGSGASLTGIGTSNMSAITGTASSTTFLAGNGAWTALTTSALPALASANIWVGNGSNVATAVAPSGDCTMTNAGAITCTKTGGTSFGALATAATANLSSQASGTLQAGQFPALTGDVTTSAGSLATTVAKIQGVSVGTPTGTGNVVMSASPTLTGTITAAAANFSGPVSLLFGTDYSTATSTQSDVAINTSPAVRYTGAGSATFYGIAAGTAGQILYLTNAATSANTLTLSNQSASDSTAANRIITGTGADLTMANNSSVILQYDGTAARWRVIGGSGGTAAGSTGQVQYNSGSNSLAAGNNFTFLSASNELVVGTGAATPAATTGTVAGFAFNVIPQAMTLTTAASSGGLTINSAATGQMAYYSGASTVSGTPNLYVSGSNIGIGTSSATNLLSLSGQGAQVFWMEREYTAATAGNSLTVQAGGAVSGGSNLAGGNLILSSGTSTGTGTSQIQFKTFPAGGSGTTDGTAAVAMTITGAGYIGIGTTNPGRSLTVWGGNGAVVGDATSGLLIQGDIAGVAQVSGINASNNTNNDIVFNAATSNILYLKSSNGFVGLGTASPTTAHLVVVDTNNGVYSGTPQAWFESNNNNAGITINNTQTGGRPWSIAATGNSAGIGGGRLRIYDGTAALDRMVFDSSGNVGIGTTSPTSTLQVSGTVTATAFSGAGTSLTGTAASLTAGTANAVSFNSGLTTGAAVTFGSVTDSGETVNGTLNVTGSNVLYFGTYGGGWYMSDTSWIRSYNGKYVYMSAGYDSGSPSGAGCSGGLGGGYTFQVCGSEKITGVLYGPGSTSTYGSITIDGSKNGWSGINFKQSGTNIKTFMIHPSYSGVYNQADNGWDWYNTGGDQYANNFYHFSDERLKNNIETVKDGLGLIEQLRGVSFDWKKTGKHAMGVIAQDVEKVMPFAVEKSLSGFKTVNSDQLFGPIIESVKELHTLFNADHDMLAKLKADNDSLRAEFEAYKKAHP